MKDREDTRRRPAGYERPASELRYESKISYGDDTKAGDLWFGEKKVQSLKERLVAAKDAEAIMTVLAEETPLFLGTCRLEAPARPLRPVLDAKGLRWCCTHEKEHCSTLTAGVEK